MAKRLRMRISRVLPSFQSCRNKDELMTAEQRPSAFCLSPVNSKALDDDFPPPPRPSPARARPRQGPVVSIGCDCGCGCGCRPTTPRHSPYHISAYDADADDLPIARETPAYLWRKEEKWHVVACADDSPRLKIDSDDGSVMFFHPPSIATRLAARRREAELRRRRRDRRTRSSRARVSTSSADSGWFSSEDEDNDEWDANDAFTKEDDDDEDEDETATLVSSYRSLSTYSSYLAPKPPRRPRIRRARVPSCPLPERPTAMHELGQAAAGAEGKVKESFAVVKRSEDPRADFRRSMAEMVVEKEIYDARDLEQLLHCFLSLNSRHHHAAIVSAFAEIWDALFPATPTTSFPNASYE